MIITSQKPYSKIEIDELKKQFDGYIKTVIDIEKKACTAGMDRQYEGEQILLESGSSQRNIWGGGIDPDSKTIDFNSFINIRPNDDNDSNEIIDRGIRKQYEDLTKFFFGVIYD